MEIGSKAMLAKKPSAENINQSMMGLIRKVHGMIENTDIEKHRQSQDHVGALDGNPLKMSGPSRETLTKVRREADAFLFF